MYTAVEVNCGGLGRQLALMQLQKPALVANVVLVIGAGEKAGKESGISQQQIEIPVG